MTNNQNTVVGCDLPSASFWEKLEQRFKEMSTTETENSEATIELSDIGIVEQLIHDATEACSEGLEYAVSPLSDDIQIFTTKQGWATDSAITWNDFKKMVVYLEPWKVLPISPTLPSAGTTLDDEEVSTQEMQKLNTIVDRIQAKTFPPVIPEELSGQKKQKVAQHILALIANSSPVKIHNYWTSTQHKYLKLNPSADTTTKSIQEAQWTQEFLYDTLARFAVEESLETGHILHRFDGDRFLSLLAHQTEGGEEAQADSVTACLRRISPALLPRFDALLWKNWETAQALLEVTGQSREEGFWDFVQREYFTILCEICKKYPSDEDIWKPMISPECFATDPKDLLKRKRIIALATAEDEKNAQKAMKIAHEVYLRGKSPKQIELMNQLDWAKNKLAVTEYYKSLQQSVEQDLQDDAHDIQMRNASENELSHEAPFTETVVSSALDLLIKGGSLKKTMEEAMPQACEYVSALNIMENETLGKQVNFQGALVWCDSDAKTLQTPSNRQLPNSNEQKVINAILIDRSGPVLVTLWGDRTEDLRRAWSAIERDTGKSGIEVRNIIDLQRVKITQLPKNAWNGDCLTQIRVLSSVEGIKGTSTSTSVNVLSKRDAINISRDEFISPRHNCCISNFQTFKGKLEAPFRVTIKGVVADTKPMEMAQSGNPKELRFLFFGVYRLTCNYYLINEIDRNGSR